MQTQSFIAAACADNETVLHVRCLLACCALLETSRKRVTIAAPTVAAATARPKARMQKRHLPVLRACSTSRVTWRLHTKVLHSMSCTIHLTQHCGQTAHAGLDFPYHTGHRNKRNRQLGSLLPCKARTPTHRCSKAHSEAKRKVGSNSGAQLQHLFRQRLRHFIARRELGGAPLEDAQ